MELLCNVGVLEVAGHAMLDAVATARVNLIALDQIKSCQSRECYIRTWQGPEGEREVDKGAMDG